MADMHGRPVDIEGLHGLAAQAEKVLARNARMAWLVITAVIIAVIVLGLDFMIKNAIMEQVKEANKALRGGENEPAAARFPPRGGDTDPRSSPVGRAGMVADTGMGAGPPQDGMGRPGAVAHRASGPPVSTDRDSRGTTGGGPGPGGMAVPPDSPPHPPE